jgi:hypothetical protein
MPIHSETALVPGVLSTSIWRLSRNTFVDVKTASEIGVRMAIPMPPKVEVEAGAFGEVLVVIDVLMTL